MNLIPLKNSLEVRPTVMRVTRNLFPNQEINFSTKEWHTLCENIRFFYVSISENKPIKIKEVIKNDNCFYSAKTNVYPPEFIPVMENIIKDFISKK